MRTTTRSCRALAPIATVVLLVACSDTATAPANAVAWRTASAARTTAPVITLTDLGAEIQPNAVNASGMIVGVGTNGHATLWWHGQATDLGTLGGTHSAALAINANATIVGASATAGGHQHAFVWRRGVMSDLGTLGGDYSIATAVNPSGSVVGTSRTAAGEEHAFLWENGRMQDLGTLGGPNSRAYDISPSGEVVGSSDVIVPTRDVHAFRWLHGVMTDIGTAVGSQSGARAINAAGIIAGMDFSPLMNGMYRIVLWRDTSVIEIGPASFHLEVADLAIDGSVVGRMLGRGSSELAFLWTSGTLIFLPLPDEGFPVPASDARGIDPTGRFIVGRVLSMSVPYVPPHALLWTVSTSQTPRQPSLDTAPANGGTP